MQENRKTVKVLISPIMLPNWSIHIGNGLHVSTYSRVYLGLTATAIEVLTRA